jgi:hypothetical protein
MPTLHSTITDHFTPHSTSTSIDSSTSQSSPRDKRLAPSNGDRQKKIYNMPWPQRHGLTGEKRVNVESYFNILHQGRKFGNAFDKKRQWVDSLPSDSLQHISENSHWDERSVKKYDRALAKTKLETKVQMGGNLRADPWNSKFKFDPEEKRRVFKHLGTSMGKPYKNPYAMVRQKIAKMSEEEVRAIAKDTRLDGDNSRKEEAKLQQLRKELLETGPPSPPGHTGSSGNGNGVEHPLASHTSSGSADGEGTSGVDMGRLQDMEDELRRHLQRPSRPKARSKA